MTESPVLAIETGYSPALESGQLFIKSPAEEPLVVEYGDGRPLSGLIQEILTICVEERSTYIQLLVCEAEFFLLKDALTPFIGDVTPIILREN